MVESEEKKKDRFYRSFVTREASVPQSDAERRRKGTPWIQDNEFEKKNGPLSQTI